MLQACYTIGERATCRYVGPGPCSVRCRRALRPARTSRALPQTSAAPEPRPVPSRHSPSPAPPYPSSPPPPIYLANIALPPSCLLLCPQSSCPNAAARRKRGECRASVAGVARPPYPVGRALHFQAARPPGDYITLTLALLKARRRLPAHRCELSAAIQT